MKVARYSITLALVKDRYILSLGGMTAKTKHSEICEIYDTVMQQSYSLPSLEKARSNTSAIVMKDRYVYVFPGINTISQSTIEFLDLGEPFDVKNIKSPKWFVMSISLFDLTGSSGFGTI